MTMHRPVDVNEIIDLCDRHALEERTSLDTALVLRMAALRLETYRDRIGVLAAAIERMEAHSDH